MTTTYHLADAYVDQALEQAVIAAIARQPEHYRPLPDGVFAAEGAAWAELTAAVKAGRAFTTLWEPATDLPAAADRLLDLVARRELAETQEQVARVLADDDRPTAEAARLLEDGLARYRAANSRETAECAAELLPKLIEEIETRRKIHQETGVDRLGLPTGIPYLDRRLDGLTKGLIILSAPPSAGKTTLAWQWAQQAAQEAAALYVTFENRPEDLVLRALSAKVTGKPPVNTWHVRKGLVDPARLGPAVEAWSGIAGRIALIGGTSRLTVDDVEASARRLMHRCHASRCLVVVDYLQEWAKISTDLRCYSQVREKVEVLGTRLRELATRLNSPVLAISSQNRQQGDYGDGKGKAALDSLKESGDLEYMADVVLFLRGKGKTDAALPTQRIDLVIAKHRHGETGAVSLIFKRETGEFREEAKA